LIIVETYHKYNQGEGGVRTVNRRVDRRQKEE
jgi:hypothetical protein